MKNPNIVVIGGGTGSFIVLSGLKSYSVNLSAIVTMMDSGGSTGWLRDQLGVLPPGDLRQALVALSESDQIWRKLFTYRFESGDLEGHNFGNIFLSSLEKITGSVEHAIEHATTILQTKGSVIPVTLSDTTLCATYADGQLLEGEKFIDVASEPRSKINYMYLNPTVVANPKAKEVLLQADYVVFGPGDLYTSIIPNLLVNDIVATINQSKAKKVMFVNLMTRRGQTDGFKASDFVSELGKYLGSEFFEYIFVNNMLPDAELLVWYERAGDAQLVVDDLDESKYPKSKIIRTDLLSDAKYEQPMADRIVRSLIRHDSNKVAAALMAII